MAPEPAPTTASVAPVFDSAALSAFAPVDFEARAPFPFWVFDGLLQGDEWAALAAQWPDASLFEVHRDIPRVHGQRPHNRRYLAYETSLYHPGESHRVGMVRHAQLPAAWQRFIAQVRVDVSYQAMLAAAMGTQDFSLRFAWHVGGPGDEVSPHVDAAEKLGTHIFYFTASGWDAAWGGGTLLCGGRRSTSMAPEFVDFTQVEPVGLAPNRSLLMRNGPDAWHGVEQLRCPPSAERRLFNVVIERADRPSVEPVRRRRWFRRN